MTPAVEATPVRAEAAAEYPAPAPQAAPPRPAPEPALAGPPAQYAEPSVGGAPAVASAKEEPMDASSYRARPALQPFSLPPDLVQIETTHRDAPVEEPPAGEAHAARRPRRPRPEPMAPSEPLVQVETRQGD